MTQRVERTVMINAPASVVWKTITDPALMKQWMGEELGLEVFTTWRPGTPIVIKGFHHVPFENKGTILQFEPDTLLKYNYIDSISKLQDVPENYSSIAFQLTHQENQTSLTVTIDNFPTEVIYKHVNFYWTGTLVILKKFIEEQVNAA